MNTILYCINKSPASLRVGIHHIHCHASHVTNLRTGPCFVLHGVFYLSATGKGRHDRVEKIFTSRPSRNIIPIIMVTCHLGTGDVIPLSVMRPQLSETNVRQWVSVMATY